MWSFYSEFWLVAVQSWVAVCVCFGEDPGGVLDYRVFELVAWRWDGYDMIDARAEKARICLLLPLVCVCQTSWPFTLGTCIIPCWW